MTSTVKRGCDHIFFVGFLGAGKSTLARNLGRMFHRRFVDTDRLVERKCGQTVSQIFKAEGEQRFRTLETEALESLASERSLLVSCGGGVVETPRNIELIHARSAAPTPDPIFAAPSMPPGCSSTGARCTKAPPTSPWISAAPRSPRFPIPLPSFSWSVVLYDDSSQAAFLRFEEHRCPPWLRGSR